MPELDTPKFPQGEYPRLSPNPNDPGFIPEEGEHGTPVVINTAPRKQGVYDSDQDARISALEAKTAELDGEVDDLNTELSAKMENPMTAQNDLIVGGNSGAPTRLAKGNNGELLRVNASGNVAYGKNLPIITTAPSADNTDGLIICVLSDDPATKYDGYLYLIG